MIDIPFFKKLRKPSFSFDFLSSKPTRVVGIDIGMFSTKVVQLRYESERAVLETYGELLGEGYFKNVDTTGSGGVLRYLDSDLASLLTDVLRESNVTTKAAVLSVPAIASFVTSITFPRISKKEIESAVPLEARKYIPIPMSEVILDWDTFDNEENRDSVEVLLIAVPREVVEKFKRVIKLVGLNALALEIETFSLVRSAARYESIPTAFVNIGHIATTLAVVDERRLRVSHSIDHGSLELTKALERGLNVNTARAEAIKREVGLSERVEEREIASVITPLVEILFSEIERLVSLYNRKASRKIQKINLAGGGANLRGLIEYVASRFGMEVARAQPFSRVVSPPFMQPVLRELGPPFAVAAGLAMREITTR
jgi:type IV pilus assembly protein PilM